MHDWCLWWMLSSLCALQKNAVVHISHAWLKITDEGSCERVRACSQASEESRSLWRVIPSSRRVLWVYGNADKGSRDEQDETGEGFGCRCKPGLFRKAREDLSEGDKGETRTFYDTNVKTNQPTSRHHQLNLQQFISKVTQMFRA